MFEDHEPGCGGDINWTTLFDVAGGSNNTADVPGDTAKEGHGNTKFFEAISEVLQLSGTLYLPVT